ncbi:Arginase/deacetylase [Auriscalpium vulgare]|uniref:Arginase/deacetylase n=1 Tax=Auriscalpium vulgare TaxID=40419 RepID=A0ACB8RDW9_9AGAM|nr:Arginase/deacetylase [Auriscalpium vulgare]
MKVVYHTASLIHDPPFEFISGQPVPYFESPARWLTIKRELESAGTFEFVEADDTIDVLKYVSAVHGADYLAYLVTAYTRWVADGGDKSFSRLEAQSAVLPEAFPHPQVLAVAAAIDPGALSPIARAGFYCFDLSCPITEDTYPSIVASARVALHAAQLLATERGVFALCRPPGHHAGTSVCGGYCFINNIAVAARFLQRTNPNPNLPVAILDIDYHHGNGTQEIFYSDSSVLYVSLHAQNDYPYFTGSAAERGAGAGLGSTINHPLPRGTGDDAYCAALADAVAEINAFSPAYVLVSLGVDTFVDDPISDFALSRACYARMGRAIAQLRRPTLFVLEG